MTEEFRETLLDYPHPLFYNTTGSTIAYKLCVKHLSFAPVLGLAQMAGATLYPKKALHIVDFDKERIDTIQECIELIKLRTLK